ncbi:MAG: transglycosylase SLT domain-containing protein [Desulfatiglandaceae bacterium]
MKIETYKFKFFITAIKFQLILPITLIFVLLLSPINAIGFDKYIDIADFDEYFYLYTTKYFGSDFDWRYFKAQAIAESRLSPQAQSNYGAMGLMQILPSTFDELKRKNPNIRGSISEPRWNIEAGIYYNSMLWDEWAKERSFDDRLNFMFASYNAGMHTILKAQKVAIDRKMSPYLWSSIAEILPEVNGPKSRETVSYVKKIHNITEKIRNHKETSKVENTENR